VATLNYMRIKLCLQKSFKKIVIVRRARSAPCKKKETERLQKYAVHGCEAIKTKGENDGAALKEKKKPCEDR